MPLLLLFGVAWSTSVQAQWHVDGAPVCAAASNQLSPAILGLGGGASLVVWFDYRNGNADIYAHRLLASGAPDPGWPSDGRAMCTALRNQLATALASDGAGGAIVSWHDFRGGNTADVYAHHVLASGAVDPTWPANGRALTTASDDQVDPGIVGDGAGGAFVVWTDYSGGPESDIRVQHVLASGALDPGWPGNGHVVCAASGNQSVPVIVADGSGGAVVAWSDLRGAHSDIYAHHVLASGPDAAWPADGLALCTASGNQSGPAIAADGAGGFVVAWHDYRSALDADVYAQRVLPVGAADPAWPAGGRLLCGAVDEQYATAVVTDGGAGAFVVWYDYRDGPEGDVYAQRVLGSGAVDPAWPADGRALCTAPGDQVTPEMTSDGQGAAVVVWHDYRGGVEADVYTQRVLGTGAVDPAWPADGRALCLAPGDQFTPAIAADGSGGTIATWMDFRPGIFSDAYAQRTYAGGAVAAVGAQNAPRLEPPWPNPARSTVAFALRLDEPDWVSVAVVDLMGRRVRRVASSVREAGIHRFEWDGADDAGAPQANGVYFLRATVGARELRARVALVR